MEVWVVIFLILLFVIAVTLIRPIKTGGNESMSSDFEEAVKAGSTTRAKWLLDSTDVNVNSTNQEDNTALMIAAEKGDRKMVEMLLEKGARVDAKHDHDGQTALMRAVWGPQGIGHPEIVKLLLEKGANVNMTDTNKQTPLMLASRTGQPVLVKLLLDNCANVNMESWGKKAIDMVHPINYHDQTVQLLKEAMSRKN